MDALLTNSDTLLRPDVGLLLPAIAAYSQNWLLLVLATAIQPLKWQSGCGCFVKLCVRKHFSIRIAVVLGALAPLLHFALSLPTSHSGLLAAATAATFLLSCESRDTLVLKAVYMALAFSLPASAAVISAAVVTGIYAYGTGWRVRGSESKDVAAANEVWLVTRDGRLAKRVSNSGDFHLEYVVDGARILVGDGRLVGARGEGLRDGLNRALFAQDKANLVALEALVQNGKVVAKGDSVGFAN